MDELSVAVAAVSGFNVTPHLRGEVEDRGDMLLLRWADRHPLNGSRPARR